MVSKCDQLNRVCLFVFVVVVFFFLRDQLNRVGKQAQYKPTFFSISFAKEHYHNACGLTSSFLFITTLFTSFIYLFIFLYL